MIDVLVMGGQLLGILIVGVILVYLVTRVVTAAYFKSKYEALLLLQAQKEAEDKKCDS